MTSGNVYKPRYTVAYLAKNKVWPYKNSRLRRFFALRGRRLHRGGLFRRYVLVFTTRKWTEVRRQFRPQTRRTGYARAGGATTAFGRPRSRRYRDSFYRKQQLRAYFGKRRESTLRSFVQKSSGGLSPITGQYTRALSANLGTRLDHLLFRRRFRPTIYACHQFVRHIGVTINGQRTYAPQAHATIGDRLSLLPSVFQSQKSDFISRRLQIWRIFRWDLFVRRYYRRWGLYVSRRRNLSQLRKKVRLFAYNSISHVFPLREASSATVGSVSTQNKPFTKFVSNRNKSLQRFGQVTEKQKLFQFEKVRSYVKFRLAIRIRSSFLPRLGSSNRYKQNYVRASRRQALLRFNFTRRTKVERRRKFLRLQPVHFIRPSYIQRDFRTLQAILVHIPVSEELSFPFRGSVKQVEAFYHSRGILFYFLILLLTYSTFNRLKY